MYLKNHKFLTGTTVFVILLFILASILPPQILKIIVDDVLEGGEGKLLLLFAILYMSSYVLIGVLGIGKEALLVWVSQGVSKFIRTTMLKHVNRMDCLEFNRMDTASLEAYFNNDVQAINRLITSGLVSICIDSFKIIGIVASIFIFSVRFGVFVLILLPILGGIVMFMRNRMFQAQMKAQRLEGEVNHLVYENIENMESLKLYDDGYSLNKYGNVLEQHFRSLETSVYYIAIFSPIMELIRDVIIALLIILTGGFGNLTGMSVGEVVAVIALITDLFTPVLNLGMELQTVQKSMAGLARINEFFKISTEEVKSQKLDLQKVLQENNLKKKFSKDGIKGDDLELRFEKVSFSYDGKEQVISDFDFVIKDNEKITLKGRSGAGKSTIMKLSYGLLKPSKGRVTLNGKDVYLLDEETRAGLFGFVYQEPFFSGETILEELTMHKEVSEEKVRKALDMVGLQRITNLRQKFVQSDFSTGELSLLNIARVILTDCRILFLDEMNAKIDPATAEKIMRIMNEIAEDKMIISINHYGELLKNSTVFQV